MRWMIIFLFPLCLLGQAAPQAAKFAENQCRSVPVSKGEIGEGQLKYCDNGTDQEIYLSGELDIRATDRNAKSAADFLALKQILREFKKRFGVTYGFAISTTDDNDRNYAVSSIPTTFLIDRRGRVRFISIGSSDVEGAALNKMIKKLIDEPAPVSTSGLLRRAIPR